MKGNLCVDLGTHFDTFRRQKDPDAAANHFSNFGNLGRSHSGKLQRHDLREKLRIILPLLWKIRELLFCKKTRVLDIFEQEVKQQQLKQQQQQQVYHEQVTDNNSWQAF